MKRYVDIARLSQLLYADLEALLEADFPLQSLPSPLERERNAHEAFEETRARVYIGRQYYFDTINAHFAGDTVVPMVVVGGSGLGKVPSLPPYLNLCLISPFRVPLCAIGLCNIASPIPHPSYSPITLEALLKAQT